jgi:ribosomal protein L37AE/L43A
MARPTGSRVYPCPKCEGRIVAKIGSSGTCKHCGTKIRFTRALFGAPVAAPAKKPIKKGKK